jgi:hypothetical protein
VDRVSRKPVAHFERLSEKHRLVYLVDGDDLMILQARFPVSHGSQLIKKPSKGSHSWRGLPRRDPVAPVRRDDTARC